MQIGKVAPDEAPHEAEQIVDFLPRARPILRREAEQREMGDAELERSLDRAPHAIHALAMTLGARQAPLGCPAAIAIHNDGDAPRYRYLGLRPAKLLYCKRHVFGAPNKSDRHCALGAGSPA